MRGEDQGWAEGHMSLSLRSLADRSVTDLFLKLPNTEWSCCRRNTTKVFNQTGRRYFSFPVRTFTLAICYDKKTSFPEESICSFKLMQSGNDATGTADMKQFYRNWKIKAVASLCSNNPTDFTPTTKISHRELTVILTMSSLQPVSSRWWYNSTTNEDVLLPQKAKGNTSGLLSTCSRGPTFFFFARPLRVARRRCLFSMKWAEA